MAFLEKIGPGVGAALKPGEIPFVPMQAPNYVDRDLLGDMYALASVRFSSGNIPELLAMADVILAKVNARMTLLRVYAVEGGFRFSAAYASLARLMKQLAQYRDSLLHIQKTLKRGRLKMQMLLVEGVQRRWEAHAHEVQRRRDALVRNVADMSPENRRMMMAMMAARMRKRPGG